ncbi:hypothetical protein NX059_010780 [Plenodomus lindquistii]|nr:hypothetical protein NX059_010780 [Plenodomus lindquistii]
MLGFLSYNDMTRELPDETKLKYTIGVGSPKKELVAHNGVFYGSSCALYTFADTQSAIVAFANGQQDADAAEFAVQIITQALFDLKPEVDILSLARQEVFLRKQNFTESLLFDWESDREIGLTEPPREQYVGKYEGHATWLSIIIQKDTAELCVQFNSNKDSRTTLLYYEKDTYSFFPASRDQYLKDSMIDFNDHELALLYFQRDVSGKVSGLLWKWDHEGGPSMFQRKDQD